MVRCSILSRATHLLATHVNALHRTGRAKDEQKTKNACRRMAGHEESAGTLGQSLDTESRT